MKEGDILKRGKTKWRGEIIMGRCVVRVVVFFRVEGLRPTDSSGRGFSCPGE